jgi:16S rRNA processing protein RimM
MFNINNCFELGNITRPHGVSGEVLLFIDSDNPSHYSKLKSCFLLINGQLVPYFITKIQVLHNGNAIVKFEDIHDVAIASDLAYVKVYLPLEQLPKLKPHEYYLHEIIGFTMIDEEVGEVGKITQYYEAKGQDLLGVDHNGIEILVPKNKEFIKKVDKELQQVFVSLPEGYIEVFTSNK